MLTSSYVLMYSGVPGVAGAKALVKLQAPQADELGFVKSLAVQEIGGTKCIVLQQDSSLGSTVVLRGSTDQVIDDCLASSRVVLQ